MDEWGFGPNEPLVVALLRLVVVLLRLVVVVVVVVAVVVAIVLVVVVVPANTNTQNMHQPCIFILVVAALELD